MKEVNSPRFFKWLFQLYCNPRLEEIILGDLEEQFDEDLKESGPWKAKLRFAWNVIRFFRPGIVKNFEGTQKINYYGMFKHNLKISYRNLSKRKSSAFINIGGLVMGLTITLLIALWIQDELSFDKHNENYDRVARVMQNQKVNGEVFSISAMPFPLHIELEKQYGEDFEKVVPASWFGDYNLSKDETFITVRGGFMGKEAPDLMSIDMVKGNRKSLAEESVVLLSASVAKALFGDNDPLGKTIKVHNEVDLNVAGIFEDISPKSSFHGVTFIGNWDFYISSQDWINKSAWNDNSFQLFVQFGENATASNISEKISRLKYNNTPESERLYDTKLFLHPMSDWHLRSSWDNGVQTGGAIQYVWWFGIIGGFILLLACVNFMNLSTAQSIKRAKEIGIRKAIGIGKSQLLVQFLTESMLIAFIAFFLATAATFLLLPYFNYLSDKEIILPFASFQYWIFGMGFAFFTGLVAGSYPAIYLSSFNAIQALKGTFQTALSAIFFRKVLVIFQFTISVALIVGMLIISQQIDYASERPLGYDNSGTISIEMTSPEHYSKSEVIENELEASGVISHFTQSSAPMTEVWNENDGFSWEGMNPNFNPMFCTFFVNHSYGKTIDWEIIEGRDFSKEYSSDSVAMIVNEAAIQYMQLDNPINKKIRWYKDFKIVGVIKNMLVESPFGEVRPAVYVVNPSDMVNFTLIKLNPKVPTMEALLKVENVFEKHLSKVPFNFNFVSDQHNKKFKKVKRMASIFKIFAVLAILISCLGLFGLISFMAEQRTKEIGIRKVLGASVINLWQLLSKEYLGLVLISCIIASPLAYYFLQNWLSSYDYRIEIGWLVFAKAFVGALLLTVLTISFRSLKAAATNPVDSLKNE